MAQFINRKVALSHPLANGKYDREHANEHFIAGFESYKEWIEGLPFVDMNEWQNVLPIEANEWIPIDERLPDVDVDVLVTTTCGDIRVDRRSSLLDDFAWFNSSRVVAWMPLPNPYRKDD